MSLLNFQKFNIKFTHNSQINNELVFDGNEKMENILKKYSQLIGINLNSLIFLYNGAKIENIDKTLYDTMNNEDKSRNEMNIVSYNISINESVKKDTNFINIIFSVFSKSTIKMQFRRKEKMENICFQFASQNGFELDSTIFKYLGKEIDKTKTFDEFAISYDKQCNGMTILVYNKHSLIVNFRKEGDPYEMSIYKEDKVRDIFQKYILEKGFNLNELSFKYNNIHIDNYEQTFNELINKYPESSVMNLNENNETEINETFNNSIHEIDIFITVNIQPNSCFKKYKKLLIILTIIGILIIIGLIIIFIVKPRPPDPIPSDTILPTEIPSDTILPTEIPTEKPEPKECDPGYFIPDDDEILQDCQKCSLEGCIK